MWKKPEQNQDRSDSPASKFTLTHDTPTAPERSGEAIALIGACIEVKGEIGGSEDLTIEGAMEGTVRLPSNTVVIGTRGRVKADIFGNVILVYGSIVGNLMAGEKVIVFQSGNVVGNIMAPRVLVEDGAKIKGSIDMDSPPTEGRSTTKNTSKGSQSSSTYASKVLDDSGEVNGGRESSSPRVL